MNNILKVEAGKPHRMQISPFGVFAKREADGTTTEQVCDEIAFRRVIGTWAKAGRPKILIDYDHDRTHTAAGAWITSLEIDPVDGLLAVAEFTPGGAEAVNAMEYRFLSADWDVSEDDDRPFKLRTLGMTNRPNIPVRPILNSTSTDSAPTAAKQNQQQGKPKMDKIALALGLDATATEADVLAKIEEINGKMKAAEDAALEAEAAGVATENAKRIENSEAFINAYKTNPTVVKATLAALKAQTADVPAPSRRVTNSESALAPAMAGARKFKDAAAARAELAKQPVGSRQAFYSAHKSEIDG